MTDNALCLYSQKQKVVLTHLSFDEQRHYIDTIAQSAFVGIYENTCSLNASFVSKAQVYVYVYV